MLGIPAGTIVALALALPVALLPAGDAGAPQDPVVAAVVPAPAATAVTTAFSDAEMEQFLRKGKVVRTRTTEKGVTNSLRATLSAGGLSHDAHIQTVDEYRREFRSAKGVEFDFRDSWTFNIAAYRIDRLLGLNLVPVSVQGNYRSDRAALTWWIDDVLMDDGERLKKKVSPPDPVYWNQQMYLLRLFDQLIANTDRNLGNILIDRNWRVWAIDHTRAFRKHADLKNPDVVTRCDRDVFERLKALDRDTLKREIGRFVDEGHIRTLLARRDAIVEKLESLGDHALFDRVAGPRR